MFPANLLPSPLVANFWQAGPVINSCGYDNLMQDIQTICQKGPLNKKTTYANSPRRDCGIFVKKVKKKVVNGFATKRLL